MSNLVSLVLSLLILAIKLAAQDPAVKPPFKTDSMTNESKRFLVRWAESTLGFRLSNDEDVNYSDDNVIIIALKGHPSRIIATYHFSPTSLSPGLQLELLNVQTVILAASGPESNQKKFYPVPEWLGALSKLEALVLSNAELSNLSICKDHPLKYLDLRNIRCLDKHLLLEIISDFGHLKIFVHDDFFSDEDLSIIKERLPDVRFASKKSAR